MTIQVIRLVTKVTAYTSIAFALISTNASCMTDDEKAMAASIYLSPSPTAYAPPLSAAMMAAFPCLPEQQEHAVSIMTEMNLIPLASKLYQEGQDEFNTMAAGRLDAIITSGGVSALLPTWTPLMETSTSSAFFLKGTLVPFQIGSGGEYLGSPKAVGFWVAMTNYAKKHAPTPGSSGPRLGYYASIDGGDGPSIPDLVFAYNKLVNPATLVSLSSQLDTLKEAFYSANPGNLAAEILALQ